MKRLSLKTKRLLTIGLLALQHLLLYSQVADTIGVCILKYKHYYFEDNNMELSPDTVFKYPNGMFFIYEGFFFSPDEELGVSYIFFDNKQRPVKNCNEIYIAENDSLLPVVMNYFPWFDSSSDTSNFTQYLKEYSLVLHGFGEQLLLNDPAAESVRIVFPCNEIHIDQFRDTPRQIYVMIRLETTGKDSRVFFKRGYFDQHVDFVVDKDSSLTLTPKEAKLIRKILTEVDLDDHNKIYADAIGNQKLFELNIKNKHSLYLRAYLYKKDHYNTRQFNGLRWYLADFINKRFERNDKLCQ